MPAFIKTPADEKLWQRAKQEHVNKDPESKWVKKDWAIVTTIWKNLKKHASSVVVSKALMHPGLGKKEYPELTESNPNKVWAFLVKNRGKVFELSTVSTETERYTARIYQKKIPGAGGKNDVCEIATHRKSGSGWSLEPTNKMDDRDLNEREFQTLFKWLLKRTKKASVRLSKIVAKMKRPPKAMIEKAVKATQIYLGSSKTVTRIRDQEKLYERMMTSIKKLKDWATKQGYGADLIYEQVQQEARRRGPIMPEPGKHF